MRETNDEDDDGVEASKSETVSPPALYFL
jgi:hypothetical protein